MADISSMIVGIVSGGVGTSLGAIGAAIVQSRTQKGEARATAADIVTGASAKIIVRLEQENKQMREAIVLISTLIDELIEDMPVDDPAKIKLRKANRHIKLSVNPIVG